MSNLTNKINIFYFIIVSIQFLLGSYSEPKNIRIIATTNVNGETDPCG